MIQNTHMAIAARTARRRWPERGTNGGEATSSSHSPSPKSSRLAASNGANQP